MVDMTWQQWSDVLDPKVKGTWNLHEATLSQPLGFFWMASSLIAVVEGHGQGNYSAANTFLEAFCQYRHSIGLPASVLNISAISHVGFVAENAEAERSIRKAGLVLLGEREFLDFLELSLLDGHPPKHHPSVAIASWSNPAQVVMGLRSEGDLDDPNDRTIWRRNRRMGIYHNARLDSSTSTASKSSAIKEFLDRANSHDGAAVLSDRNSVIFLAQEIGTKIYDMLLRSGEEVELGLTLAQMGLDSIGAVEMKRWFRATCSINISVLEIMAIGSLEQLAEMTAAKLLEKLNNE